MEAIVREAAALVRAKLDTLRIIRIGTPFEILEYFPDGCCKLASLIYLYYVREYRGIDPRLLYLVANAQITKDRSHAWARVGGFQVDITGDQFGAAKVVVSDSTLWPGLYAAPNEYPLSGMDFEKTYEAKLVKVCRYIDG
jgi:hypothetical protein